MIPAPYEGGARHAYVFASYMRTNETLARDERSKITLAAMKQWPELREVVDADVQRLASEAVKARQYADLSDLTRAGYTNEIALHFVDRLTIGRRSTQPRFGIHEINHEGEAA